MSSAHLCHHMADIYIAHFHFVLFRYDCFTSRGMDSYRSEGCTNDGSRVLRTSVQLCSVETMCVRLCCDVPFESSLRYGHKHIYSETSIRALCVVQSSSMGKPSALVVLSSFIAVFFLRNDESASARLVAVQTQVGHDLHIYGVDEKESSVASLLDYKVRILIALSVTIVDWADSSGSPHAYLIWPTRSPRQRCIMLLWELQMTIGFSFFQ
jgi:hypothetical protein